MIRWWSVEYVFLRWRFVENSDVLQFYLDDLGDELTITALRMLVKDLLILFQAGNEGVINVLGMFPQHFSSLNFRAPIFRTLFRDVAN